MKAVIHIQSADDMALEQATDDGWKCLTKIAAKGMYSAEFVGPDDQPTTFRLRAVRVPGKKLYESKMTNDEYEYVPWEELPEQERKAWATVERGPLVRFPAGLYDGGNLVAPAPAE